MQRVRSQLGRQSGDNRESFLSGLALGLKLALIGLAIACVIGLLVAFARTSRHRWLSLLAAIYIEFIRNIPLLLILFFLYFGVPMWAYSHRCHAGVADILVWTATTRRSWRSPSTAGHIWPRCFAPASSGSAAIS